MSFRYNSYLEHGILAFIRKDFTCCNLSDQISGESCDIMEQVEFELMPRLFSIVSGTPMNH